MLWRRVHHAVPFVSDGPIRGAEGPVRWRTGRPTDIFDFSEAAIYVDDHT
jgi:hypothetical protein